MTAPSRPRRVLLVAHWDWVLFHFRLPLANVLRDRGHDVRIVCPEGKYSQDLRRAGFRTIAWRLERATLRPTGAARSIRQLAQIYRAEQPWAVQHFTVKPNLFGSVAAARARVPVVINTFSGLGWAFSSGAARIALHTAATPWKAIVRGPRRWTISQTSEDLRTLVRLGLADAECASVIPGSGVDTSVFRPWPKPLGPPVVLMVSRLLSAKGIEEFVVAARHLHDRGVSAEFVIAGDPDPGNPASVPDHKLAQWKEEGSVRFLGHRNDVAQLLRDASLAVLPSWSEGVPRFLLEAAASGVPAVATDIPGCRIAVLDGETGRLVPPKAPAILADAIEGLLSQPATLRLFGERARALAVARFDLRDIVDEYASLYDTLE